MNGSFTWKTAAKIAWRESRSSSVKFLFVILAVAVGVGSLTGVRGFSSAFKTMLTKEARTLMAADLTVRVFSMPTPQQDALIEELKREGARETQITETLTMMSSAHSANPVLVSVKAIDPAVYPFYGEVRFEPAGDIRNVLTPDAVAMSADLLIRMNVAAGDTVRIGGQDFRVAGAVAYEPDRMSGSLNIGPRVMMSQKGLDRTGLINAASRAAQRYLIQLPAVGLPVDEVRTRLKAGFPDGMVIDFRETHPIVTRGLERSTMFLSLVSLIALIVGSLGVATAMHSHLQQKLDSIAVMKCLGARSSQVIRIYLVQTLGLGLAGGTAGVLIGAAIQAAFPHLIARYFHVQPGFTLDWSSVAQGLAAGVLSTLLFTLPPLLSIRGIRPNLIFRREMADMKRAWRERLRESKASIFSSAAILVGMALLAAWLAGTKWQDALRLGAYFVLGLAVALLLLAMVAWALLRGVRLLLRNPVYKLPSTWRQGMANLYRPGNQAQAVLVSLGLGVMFTVTIYVVQRTMLEDIISNAPPGMPNVFLIDITESQRAGLQDLLSKQKGIEKQPELVPSVAARLVTVNGTPVARMGLTGWGRRMLQTRSVTWSEKRPEFSQVITGQWWKPGSLETQVSVAEEAAKVLKVKVGDTLEFTSAGRALTGRIASTHRTEAVRVGAATEFVFNKAALEGFPVIFYGGLRMKAESVAAMQRAVYRQYPTVSVVNVADVINTIQEVVDQIALVVRFISAFAILAGVIILASSIAGTRFRRLRETAILKTLGGTRRRIAGIFSVEFLVLGAVAGLLGGLLATGFSNVILIRFFEADFRFDIWPVLTAVLLSAILANIAGWAASFRILGQKPLEVLRAE